MRKHKLLILALVVLLGTGLSFTPVGSGGADQVNFPDIYLDESVAPGGVGSLADPYSDFSEINWTTGGDNSVFDAVAANEDVTINLQMGEEWRETLTIGTSGSAAHPITIQSYGAGAKPIINGADLVATWSADVGTDYTGDANLLALWYLEEASGVRFDETANSVDLDDNNTVTRTATHKQGTYAASFASGTSESLSAADAALPATWPHSNGASDTDYSMGGWFYFNAVDAAMSIASKIWSFGLYLDATAKVIALIKEADTTAKYCQTAAAAVSATTWHHIVLVVNSGGNAYMYIDGSDVTSGSTTITDLEENASAFIWGLFSGVAYFDGYMDELFMFDRALSGAEIANIESDLMDGSAGGVADVWTATLTTEPSQVFFDGTRGTSQASKAACDGEFDWYWAANILYVYSTGDPDDDYTSPGIEASVRNTSITINGEDYITIQDIDLKYANQDNIAIDGGSDNVIIDTVDMSYGYWRNMYISAASGTCSNNTVKNSTITYAGGDGIWIGTDTDTTLIQNNTVHHNCQLDIDVGKHIFNGGIKANGASCVGLIIENNSSYANGVAQVDGTGVGIWVDTDVPAPIIRYNAVYDNAISYGIYVETVSDAEVYYNICWDNKLGIGLRGDATVCTGNHIYNNVIYSSTNQGIVVYGDDITAGCISNNLIRNNISVANGQTNLWCATGGENDGIIGSGNVYEYNCLDAEALNFILWGAGVNVSTYDAWEVLYGATTNSVEVDPLMTDPANDDFTLNPHSLCVNAGTDVSLTEDYLGLKIRHTPDIGAYENQTNAIFFPIPGIGEMVANFLRLTTIGGLT